VTTQTWIGKSIQRVDGVDKVRGTLAFSGDLYAEGMLHCRPVLAPYPHARLLGVDCEAALQVHGVRRVITAADIPGAKHYNSLFTEDHPVLCEDKVRYIGDTVALVVAENEAAAEAGVKQVRVDYEPLPLVTDPEAVLQGACDVRVHEDQDNVLYEVHHVRGDVEAEFARPDALILEQTYRLQAMDHAFLETETGTAFPEDGGVRVVSGSQSAYLNRASVAKCLDLPEDKVRMVEPFTGGAFGGKANLTVHILVALAAYVTGQPCRLSWTRREHFLAGVKRHPLTIQLKTAATRAGEFLALQGRIVIDTGAYVELGTVFMDTVIENITGPYKIENVHLDVYLIYTNNMSAGAFRGLGAPEACTALESQVSQMAHLAGMDPLEFRRHNLLAKGDIHGAGHEMLLPVGTSQALEKAAGHELWKKRAQVRAGSSGSIRRGVGVGIGMKGYSMGINDAYDYESAILDLLPNGRFELKSGVLEGGQGALTALTQITAEALNCPPEQIDVVLSDTGQTLDLGMTAASRGTYVGGRAACQAAEDLTAQILQAAAEDMTLPVDQLSIQDGRIVDRVSGNSLGLDVVAEAASKPLRAEVNRLVPLADHPSTGILGHPHVLYSSMTQIAQVAVDVDTGQVTVEKVVCFPDLGRAINPQGVEGQCEGGVAQGLGYALMEHVLIEDGVVRNPDLSTYPTPTAWDVPLVETVLVEVPETSGPYGAKGIGENVTVPTAAAVLNAIKHAIGVRFTSMPVVPERVVVALAEKSKEK
jgi:CO/xanthine dehydrogenase Mo-binding subunit